MKKSGNISLLSSVIFFVIGLILFMNPDAVIKFISYCIGGVLILVGAYKVANYYIQDKRLGVVNRNEMAFGITAIVLGVVFIFLASAIELLLRFIVGGYLIISGLGRIMQTFYTTDRTYKFYALIVMGLLFIGVGLYTVIESNLPLKVMGLFMLLYGLINFVSYFVYRDKQEKTNEKPIVIEDKEVQETEVVVETKDSKENKETKDKEEVEKPKKGRKKKK